jgi:hypothetical protein
MSPILGNAHLKRILGANRSTLDFGKVIEAQQICLVNLAQPYLIQRSIALATELDKRAKTGAVSPRKKWRH